MKQYVNEIKPSDLIIPTWIQPLGILSLILWYPLSIPRTRMIFSYTYIFKNYLSTSMCLHINVCHQCIDLQILKFKNICQHIYVTFSYTYKFSQLRLEPEAACRSDWLIGISFNPLWWFATTCTARSP